MTIVKVCGISDVEHAMTAVEAGADFIGMVFAPSRRKVTVQQAAEIVDTVRKMDAAVKTVGVFVNSPANDVNRITAQCSLDIVQVSGDESWDYCKDIAVPVIKTVHIKDQSADELVQHIQTGFSAFAGKNHIVLLDTHVDGRYGGTGKTFDWELARAVSTILPVLVAGGLTPDNVRSAIETIKPWGVDVSSGVETNGVKDINKITKFVDEAKR